VDVELHHLVALAAAGVGDVDGRGEASVPPHRGRAQPQVRDVERRVAEPEAEPEQRVAGGDVAVLRVVLGGLVARPPGRLVVVVDRHLAHPVRERRRQLAAGVDLPEHDVGDRVARLDAREPSLEDRRRVVDDVLERQRSPAEQHDRDRLAGRLDRA
jgi:hypothetical protein